MSENKEKRNLDKYREEMMVHVHTFLMGYTKTIEEHENNLEMESLANLYLPIAYIIANSVSLIFKSLEDAPSIKSMLEKIEALTLKTLADLEL
jgi:hypothetical protein